MSLLHLMVLWVFLTKNLAYSRDEHLNLTDGEYQLGFYLNGVIYPNGSAVPMHVVDIGEGEYGLYCITDRHDCCRPDNYERRIGEFYFPNGSVVPIRNYNYYYYRDRGDRFVRLNRRSYSIITGQFRCEIPNAKGTLVNLFIYIVSPGVSITSDPASPIQPVGSKVTLTCTIVKFGPTVNLPMTRASLWTSPQVNSTTKTAKRINNLTNVTNQIAIYTSTITINSFMRSHSGNYTCTANTNSTTVLITTGVYLSLNGVYLEPNSDVPILEIGTSSNDGFPLVCTSDRMPCCRSLPQYGEWYFPNGSQVVHITEGAVRFHRNRDDSGNINLFRVNNSVTSPLGHFCCEVEDIRHTNKTVCVNLVNLTSTSTGSLTSGETQTLECFVSGTTFGNNITFQWLDYDGRPLNSSSSRVISHHQTKTCLQLSERFASHSGQYTCQAKFNSGFNLEENIPVHVNVKEVIVSVTSNTLNPILSGSSLSLTCTVEFTPLLDIPVSVNTVWSGPNGKVITVNTTTPVLKSVTLYTSNVTLDFIKLSDSGDYTCNVSVRIGDGDSIEWTSSANIIVADKLFQLRLESVDICKQWYGDSYYRYRYGRYIQYYTKVAVVKAIEHRCQCHFPKTNLLEERIICQDSPDLMTYRGTLIGTHNFNGSQIVRFIQDWVNAGPLIKIEDSYVRVVYGSCPVAISSLDDPECGEKEGCVTYDNDPISYVKCAAQLGNHKHRSCFQECLHSP